MAKTRALYVIDRYGRVLIRPEDCNIHSFVPLYDGFAIVRFGNEGDYYIAVEDAIAWHDREYQGNKNEIHKVIRDTLTESLQKIKLGKVVELQPPGDSPI